MMRTWFEAARIREVQVLSDQKSRLFLRRLPNLAIRMTSSLLVMNCMNVMCEFFKEARKPKRKILVKLDLHRMFGLSKTGKSSSAEAAANAMAA